MRVIDLTADAPCPIFLKKDNKEVGESKSKKINELDFGCGSWSRNIDPRNVRSYVGRPTELLDSAAKSISVRIIERSLHRTDNMGMVKKVPRIPVPSPIIAPSIYGLSAVTNSS